MHSANAIYILDSYGKIIIRRNYRKNLSCDIEEIFNEHVITQEDDLIKPVFFLRGIVYCWMKYNDIYFIVTTVQNSNVFMLLTFINSFIQVLKDSIKTLNADALRDNFVLIYELLDEVMDFGFPQVTDGSVLRQYIKNHAYELFFTPKQQEYVPDCVTKPISWRSDNIKYRKNEIFLDVIEKVNMLLSSSGDVLSSEIIGAIIIKSHLSGMPEVKLGLNDKLQVDLANIDNVNSNRINNTVELDNILFHKCVDLTKFQSERVISFIPPDGEFELMTYRITDKINPLFHATCTVEEPKGSTSRYELSMKLNSLYKHRSSAHYVELDLPLPNDINSSVFKSSYGSAEYCPEKNSMIWKISSMAGQKELVLHSSLGIPTTVYHNFNFLKKSINMYFTIPYFTVSNIIVRYVKVTEKSNYQVFPWVRYMTKNGDYQIRIS